MALPKLADPNTSKKWRGYLWLLVGGVLAAVGGIVVGLLWQGGQADPLPLTGGRELLIQKIELGALVQEADPAALNPVMLPKSSYKTTDKVVLRVTTTDKVVEPFAINARLLSTEGVIVELDPGTVTFQPGVSSFCCWQLPEEGNFNLQLFRPEKVVTSLPVQVRNPGEIAPKPQL